MSSKVSYVSQMQNMGVINSRKVQEQYGISAESFNDIQHRLDSNAPRRDLSRAEQAANKAQQQPGQVTLAQSELIMKLKEALEWQAMQFDRFRQITEQKFTTLSKDLLDVTMELKQARETITRIKDKDDAIAARAALQRYQQGDRAPVSQAIDRNGVAPSQVQIQDIFNCSGKRF